MDRAGITEALGQISTGARNLVSAFLRSAAPPVVETPTAQPVPSHPSVDDQNTIGGFIAMKNYNAALCYARRKKLPLEIFELNIKKTTPDLLTVTEDYVIDAIENPRHRYLLEFFINNLVSFNDHGNFKIIPLNENNSLHLNAAGVAIMKHDVLALEMMRKKTGADFPSYLIRSYKKHINRRSYSTPETPFNTTKTPFNSIALTNFKKPDPLDDNYWIATVAFLMQHAPDSCNLAELKNYQELYNNEKLSAIIGAAAAIVESRRLQNQEPATEAPAPLSQ